jgi:ketosteroid isomerase-like protein
VTSSVTTAILAANEAFYRAFTGGDAEGMSTLWAEHHPVACSHPGRAALHGREAVLASWAAILGAPEPTRVQITRAAATVLGDTAALVTCIEHIGEAELAASNVFVLERGAWRLVHHHAGPLARRVRERTPSADDLN